MPAKRKDAPQQPELPIEGARRPPRATARTRARPGRTGRSRPGPAFRAGQNRDCRCTAAWTAAFSITPPTSSATAPFPNLSDGLKPVQRRILWALHEKDDGRFIKVAKVVGHAMQYHPHGDASIGDALVVLANKRYVIEGQGNFGNIYTGDAAAAPRYIECRLTELARTNYSTTRSPISCPVTTAATRSRSRCPANCRCCSCSAPKASPSAWPSRILPHNFPELLEAQIAILKKQPFKVLPDFQTGGLMDAREYRDGAGQIKVRAKIKIKDDSTVVIKEIPPTTTTDSLIGLHRGRLAQRQDQGQEHQRFHVRRGRDRSAARPAA